MKTRPVIAVGVLLGIGMGGFVDGILFHQILQTHNMLSARLLPDTLVNLETNMVWDGVFHAFTWLMTALGIAVLWHAGKQRDVVWSGRSFSGSLILGWGLFNFVEGIIDHHIIGVHHVIERLGVSAYNYAFLASGVIFTLVGWMLAHGAVPGDKG